jgi:hypothetical protein
MSSKTAFASGESSASDSKRTVAMAQTSAKMRAGPPVPPRTLGAPTISVAPAAGIGRAPRGTRSRSGPSAARRNGSRNRPRARDRATGCRPRWTARRLSISICVASTWKPGKCSEPPRRIAPRNSSVPTFPAQPEFIATQAPSGCRHWRRSTPVRSSGVTCVSAVLRRAGADVDDAKRTGEVSTGISSTDWPSALKCSGASIWVPVCSFTVRL